MTGIKFPLEQRANNVAGPLVCNLPQRARLAVPIVSDHAVLRVDVYTAQHSLTESFTHEQARETFSKSQELILLFRVKFSRNFNLLD